MQVKQRAHGIINRYSIYTSDYLHSGSLRLFVVGFLLSLTLFFSFSPLTEAADVNGKVFCSGCGEIQGGSLTFIRGDGATFYTQIAKENNYTVYLPPGDYEVIGHFEHRVWSARIRSSRDSITQNIYLYLK